MHTESIVSTQKVLPNYLESVENQWQNIYQWITKNQMVIRGKSVMKRMAYQDVRIEFEKSVNGPYNTVAEVGEGESKWHVFHTPCFDD